MFGLERHQGPALIDGATVIDFPDLVDLGGCAVDPIGDRKSLLLVLVERTVPTIAFYAGGLVRGHAVALIDAAHAADIIDAYRPRWVAGGEGTASRLTDSGVGVDDLFPVAGGELVRMDSDDAFEVHDDLSVLLSTSGTTGSRKFVRLSTANVEHNATAIARYLELSPGERPISSLPLHYTYGLSILNSHWAAGAPLVLTRHGLLDEDFWETFTASECSSLACVPYSFHMLERIGFRDHRYPALRTMLAAGGRLDPSIADRYRRHLEGQGGRLFVMYGQTEATARISYVPPDRLVDKPGSVGIAIPDGELSIATDRGLTKEPDVTGEVVVSSPSVMMGYAEGCEDLALGDKLGGVLHTGDIGHFDEDGYLMLTGRSKRIAKVFGLRINLDEVEGWLSRIGPAAAVADGERIVAVCAFGDADSLERNRIELAREYRVPNAAITLKRVDAVPTKSSGKVDYERVERWIDG
jgi:acyl-CoA synthetase (AMP-forming)/AMP-acid ligase II